MDYIITLFQLFLFVLFIFILRCELSKDCSDSFIHICLRTFIMCSSAILFFMLFENKYHNSTFVSLVFIPFVSGVVYTAIESITTTKYQKGICDDFSRR